MVFLFLALVAILFNGAKQVERNSLSNFGGGLTKEQPC